MGDLLTESESLPTPHSGDIVEGRVMRVDQDGILVNIGQKSEGLVPAREMRSLTPEAVSQMRVGDPVIIRILRPAMAEEPVLLSIDRAQSEQGWRELDLHLQGNQAFEAVVTGWNRGGLLVDVWGIQGFVPISQLASLPRSQPPGGWGDALAELVGKTLTLQVLETNRQRRRAILSERLAFRAVREQRKQRLLSELREGEVRTGKVTGISGFGAFVDLGGAEGLIHISELSWRPVQQVDDLVKIGDEVQVYVLRVDSETKRIGLSLRRLQPEPWQTVTERYHVGQLVTGTVTKLVDFGAFARIEDSVEGLIHISELTNRAIHHPREVVKEGDVLTLKILRIEPERRRLGLSLKLAEEEL